MLDTTTILRSLIFSLPLLTTLLLYEFFSIVLKLISLSIFLNSYAFLYLFFFFQIPDELVEHYLGKGGFSVLMFDCKQFFLLVLYFY